MVDPDAAMPEPHLSAEEVAAYIDRALDRDGRERIESHLAGCGPCLSEVLEVQQLLRAVDGQRW